MWDPVVLEVWTQSRASMEGIWVRVPVGTGSPAPAKHGAVTVQSPVGTPPGLVLVTAFHDQERANNTVV